MQCRWEATLQVAALRAARAGPLAAAARAAAGVQILASTPMMACVMSPHIAKQEQTPVIVRGGGGFSALRGRRRTPHLTSGRSGPLTTTFGTSDRMSLLGENTLEHTSLRPSLNSVSTTTVLPVRPSGIRQRAGTRPRRANTNINALLVRLRASCSARQMAKAACASQVAQTHQAQA